MSMMLVALRKESVDRNVFWTALNHQSKRVALRKESVDRNRLKILKMSIIPKSLSARRAWIEMYVGVMGVAITPLSLSARRAWIEILT